MGLPFDAVSEAGAEGVVRAAATSGRRCFVSTPNLNFAAACLGDAEFRQSVIESDLSIADGMPIVLLARLLRAPLPERVAGSGLFERLMRGPADRPLTAYFYGGEDGVAEQAAAALAPGRCGVACVGYASPGFSSVDAMSEPAHIDPINASGAQLLVVAVGARKGQAWLLRNRDRLQTPVLAYLGAVINFVAGTVRRAPRAMQRLHLEWLWRILQEPALWRRYWNDGKALVTVLLTQALPAAARLRWQAPTSAELASATLVAVDEPGVTRLRLTGAWSAANAAPLRAALAAAVEAGRAPVVDLSAATHLDSAVVGLLILASGVRPQPVVQASPAARRWLRWFGAEYLAAR